MKKTMGNLPFHTFLLRFSLITVFVFLLLLSSLYYMKIKNFIEEKKETSVQLRMDQISTELQTEFNNIYDTVNNLKTNEIVIRYLDELGDNNLSPSEKYKQLSNLEEYLYTIRQNNKLIDNILIVTPETQFSSDMKYIDYQYNGMKLNNEAERQYHFVSIGEANRKIEIPSISGGQAVEASGSKDLNNSMFFGVNILSADGVNKGVILIFINPKNLDDYIFYADHIGLFDQNGRLFFKGDKAVDNLPAKLKKLPSSKKGLQGTYENTGIYHSSIPYYNFQLVYVEKLSFYKKQMALMWKMLVATFLFSALIAYIFSRIVGRKVLQPLDRLIESIKGYEESRNYSSLFQQKKNRVMKVSLRERFFFYFVITVLLPLVIFMVMLYGQTSKIISSDLQESYRASHEKMARLMNNEINQRVLLLTRIAYNNNVLHSMMEEDAESIGHELLNKKQYLELRRQTVKIYNLEGKPIYTNGYSENKQMDPHFLMQLQATGRNISYTLEKNHFNDVTIVIGMPAFSVADNAKSIGYITVDMEGNELAKFYADWQKTGLNMLLADQHNRILSHPDPLKIGTIVSDKESGTNYHIFKKEITGMDWKFISTYNDSAIQKQIEQLFISDAYLLALVLLLLLAFAYWISKRMLRPIGQLNSLFHTFDLQGSHHEVVEQLSGISEMDSLTQNFNKMVERMEELIHETILADQERIQLKYEKRELQLNALQSQINPHFLYNTLDNLIYLVESSETERALEMIASLSKLFRFITNREQVMITLRDELVYTKTYIKIMSYRFDNFECVWDGDEKILSYKTVKLILQPVIENAIHHGARKTKNRVTIHISCKLIEDQIHIIVKDNAIGIREDDLAIIKNHLTSATLDKAGIYNVNGRIRLHFGNQYGLDIESIWGEGTTVTIVIPAAM
ncbi:hypothetical protein BABA_21141 [Neobacillus bataviensis LMG 21833]|uniref:HAMP domain-containing protein n=1 Tax=Neobacillus bataviensis LMG 21833 TaxID=1117379 RepID=K6DWF8_9BACI|nr:histidine kinase [Neobacillus bataviensis]EKN65191.1 hypothetical protein BABA_21141 [Neobacillus bataviensis LMG 21833]